MPPHRLTVRSVETIPLRVPLARVFHGSHYRMTHRSTIVTRVRTEEGIVSEAYAGDEDGGLLEIERIIADEITPQLLGEDAFAVERCWELARPATYDILRDRRYGLVACACVDTPIWDAVASSRPAWCGSSCVPRHFADLPALRRTRSSAYRMPLPLYGSGLRILRMSAATWPTACLS